MNPPNSVTESELAALLDPGAPPEAPAAFRLAVIARAFAARQARATRTRALRFAAGAALVGGLPPAVAALGLPADALAAVALGPIAGIGALIAAVIMIEGPQRALARMIARL